MLRFFNKRIHNRKGFTLIELIVVIAILGILALIAIPRFVGVMDNAKDKADSATAVQIKNAALVAQYDNPTATIDKAYLTTGAGAGKYLAPDFSWEYSDGTAITAVTVVNEVVTLTPDREVVSP